MEIKQKLAPIFNKAGDAAKNIYDNAIHAIDQNDDGRFDLKDIAVIADAMKERAESRAFDEERRKLNPIFENSLTDANFFFPKFIRITDRGKKFVDSPVCEGAIGCIPDYNKILRSITIFHDSVDAFGLTFYPDTESEFYYVDPCDHDRYIALNDYFNYLRIARVGELQKIAQDLGAKHFKVTYKEERAEFSKKKADVHGKAAPVGADVKYDAEEKRFSTIQIAAEMSFPGRSPVRPQLKYMQKDANIEDLISMRMDEASPLMHQRFTLNLLNTAGMKESDAVKIDGVLKGLKVAGNATVASEVKNESRRYLEYEIDF